MYTVDLYMYFKVRDADMWGGKGSVGYFNHSYKDIYPLKNTHEEFEDVVLKTMEAHAKKLGVDLANIEQITREAYEAQSRAVKGKLIHEEDYYPEDKDESEE